VADDLYPGFGGQARSSQGHIAALARRGHQLTALAGRDPRAIKPPAGVTVTRLPALQLPGTQTLLALPLLSRIDPLVRQADVVHINLPTPLAAVTLWRARRAGVPVVMGIHTQIETSTLHLPRVAGVIGGLLKRWYGWLFGRADLLVAPTAFAAELARGFLRGQIEVVSNGIDLTELPPPASKAPQRPRRLAYVGRLSPETAPLALLRLMVELGPGVQLSVAGSGPLAGEMAAESERLGLAGRVKLLGFVSEKQKRELLRRTELFLMPSPAELQSIATLEAMACGCAVAAVGHASSAVPALVTEAQAGVVVDATDQKLQAQQLMALLNDAAALATAQANARAYAEQHDVDASAARLEKLYEGLRRAAPQP
jgi:glycosyltransferase involved in cell wall biosynthesis